MIFMEVIQMKKIIMYSGYISAFNISKLVKENKLVPLYAFNNNSARKIYIFYRKDVQEYKEKLEAYRDLRKK